MRWLIVVLIVYFEGLVAVHWARHLGMLDNVDASTLVDVLVMLMGFSMYTVYRFTNKNK